MPNIITYNSMLDAAVKGNNMKVAEDIFSEMKLKIKPDLISYATLIKCNIYISN